MALFTKRTTSSFSFSMQHSEPILIVGLGNVGPEYVDTRHNIGFAIVDQFARNNAEGWADNSKLNCLASEAIVDNTKIISIKPTTMMNLSGRAVQKAASYYGVVPANTIVIHDELDFDFGVVRTKEGGGSGGHNGLRSIIQTTGNDFWRIRVGIGRPPSGAAVDSYVLSRFNSSQRQALAEVTNEALSALDELITSIKIK